MNPTKIEVFTKIPDAVVILFRRGVFYQYELFSLDNEVFAKVSGGFVRLLVNNATSSGFHIHKIISSKPFEHDKFGRLVLSERE